ncbi:MAG: lipoate--protein ligase family protein [Syntrophomonas sp.]
MDLYNLGAVTWWESQCFYHALAHLGREGLIICFPSTPYVCLGLHDDLEQEIDRGYCERSGIPIFRRETGGGVVYLDSRQVFFQLVIKRDNPQLPLRRYRYYEKFLQPAISVYRQFGIPAAIKVPADIAANGKKCSGNACGDIGTCVAYVGNLLLDFDFSVMSNVLRAPYPQFREYLMQAMQNNMTTFKDWVDYSVTYDDLASRLIDEFKMQWTELDYTKPDQVLIDKATEIYKRSVTDDWLQMPGRRYYDRKIKIAEGLMLMEKRIGSNSNAVILVREGIVEDINILGRDDIENDIAFRFIGQEWNDDLLAEITSNPVI